MTNFEKIISEMAIENVAEIRIDLYNAENSMFDGYYTDNGFYHFYIDAFKAEIEWLKEEVDNVD